MTDESLSKGREKKLTRHGFFLLLTTFFLLPYLLAGLTLGIEPILNDSLFWGCRLFFAPASAGVLISLTALCRHRHVRQTAAVLLWLAVQLLVLAESFLLGFTGHTFNDAFLMHFLSLQVLLVGLRTDMGILALPGVLFLAGAGFAVWKAAASLQPGAERRHLILAAIGLVFWFVPLSPSVILASLIVHNCIGEQFAKHYSDDILRKNGVHPCPVGIHDLKAQRGKNLVFIIVESLEQNYFDPERFPGLMPYTEKLLKGKDVLYFQAMRNSAWNTFDFIYKSHMGTYMENISAPMTADRLPSLSMILDKAGYRSTFLQACSLDFAHTRDFLNRVRYQKLLDCDSPEVRREIREIGEWGFRDYDLFSFAQKEFDRLAAQKEPFFFTVLTVDGHGPNGVLGPKSLTYRFPDGKQGSLFSAVHSTDAAMGKFIEHIRNSPVGADTVIAVSGDHLLMRNLQASDKSVQSRLVEKPRSHVLCFILNGTRKGVVSQPCWAVDMAPILLYQMGVRHNYIFPSGVNILEEKDDSMRGDFSREYLTAYLREKRDGGKNGGDRVLKADRVSLSGPRNAPQMHIGNLTVPLLSLDHASGVLGVTVDRQDRDKVSAFSFFGNMTSLFQSSKWNRDVVYFLAAKPDSILHTMLNVPERDRYLLCALRSGWFRYAAASDIADLKMTDLDVAPPCAADAHFDLSGTTVCLRGNGWTLPLFSESSSIFPLCEIAMIPHADRGESVFRIDIGDPADMMNLWDMMTFDTFTLFIPPDSPLHGMLKTSLEDRSSAIRLRMNKEGRQFDYFPFHGHQKPCIRKLDGQYFYQTFAEEKRSVRLEGAAFDEHFAGSHAHAVKFDAKSEKIKSSFSYTHAEWSADMLRNRPNGQRTLMIVGGGNPLLKTYYPELASQTVLFVLTPENIRHAVQYGNGDFRIPAPEDPINPKWPVSVHTADKHLVVRWGDVSFVETLDELLGKFDRGSGLVVKIPSKSLVPKGAFISDRPEWDSDIARSETDNFIYMGSCRSKFPALLGQQPQGKYFLAVRRVRYDLDNWEFFWNDNLEFINR